MAMATDIKQAVKQAVDDLPDEAVAKVFDFIGYLQWQREKVDQSWFANQEWQTRYREAKEDIKEGRYQDFDNIDDLLACLKNQPESEE
ncbi:MAG: hypothetical protein AB4352_14405 [Hormoscilla sp.]